MYVWAKQCYTQMSNPKNKDEPKNVDKDKKHFVDEFTLQNFITYSRKICRSSLFLMFHFGVKIKMKKMGEQKEKSKKSLIIPDHFCAPKLW